MEYVIDGYILDHQILSGKALEYINILNAVGNSVVQLLDLSEKIVEQEQETLAMMTIGSAVGSIIIGCQALMEKSNILQTHKAFQAIRSIEEARQFLGCLLMDIIVILTCF